MPDKSIFELIQYCWTFSKKLIGLGIAALFTACAWWQFVFPFFAKDNQVFVALSITICVAFIIVCIVWLFWSGRVLLKKPAFTIVFCLKPRDSKSSKYIENALSMLKFELDKLGLLEKFQIIIAGSDVINSQKQAHKFRDEFDVDLIIWGEVYSGNIDKNEVCDFKKLFFTYKIPPNVVQGNLSQYFKNDINIALVNRDWNIYEVNSIVDTEKITYHLSEVIIFVLGLIYCQYLDYVEDSIVILEQLFNVLGQRTNGEKITVDNEKHELTMAPDVMRVGRLLDILTTIYKNIGIHFTNDNKHEKGHYYLQKYLQYHKNDVAVLSALALSSFNLNDVPLAKKLTDTIGKIDKNSPFYILNQAFFGIYDKNYASSLYFYKEIIKRGRTLEAVNIAGVISFLDHQYRLNRKELAYEFAIGILNKHHCQQREGIKELRNFLKLAKNKPEYTEMTNHAKIEIAKKSDKRRRH